MKNIFILSLATLCFACTKTKTNIVTVTKHDTTVSVIANQLLGKWLSITPEPAIPCTLTFFVNYAKYSTSYVQSYNYIATGDTIFQQMPQDGSTLAMCGYRITTDTLLFFYPFPDNSKPSIFIKQF